MPRFYRNLLEACPVDADEVLARLGPFRPYLHLLARARLGHGRAGLEPSDLVQLTLARAVEAAGQFHGRDEAQLAGWLRQVLAHALANELRDQHRQRRDVSRQRSLEAELEASSVRLGGLLADPAAGPASRVIEQERLLRLAARLDELPADQREAIERHHLRGEAVAEVAQAMARTPAAVAGLIKRGMKRLRQRLEESG